MLIMRRWPRGIAKGAVGEWRKELGPSPELLKVWQSRHIDWPEFRRRYLAEMRGDKELVKWIAGRAQHETVTLLCGCKDEQRCHRLLLKQIVEEVSGGN